MSSALKLVAPNHKVENLRDVQVPAKFFNKIKFGDHALDELFGGDLAPGMLPGDSILFTGAPGAGKSTACLRLADLLGEQGYKVLYNLGEENRYMVKMRADRIGCKGNYQISSYEDVNDLFERALKEKVDLLIHDSLQTLRDGDLRGHSLLISCAGKMQVLSKEHDISTIVVGQCTKGGTFAGPNEIAHSLDGHLHLSVGQDGVTKSLGFIKHRFGPTGLEFGFEMNAEGVTVISPNSPGAVSASSSSSAGAAMAKRGRGEGRRSDTKAVIRANLLAGDAISGYCFTRLGCDVSGGFWRGMVREVCEELTQEGYGVGERGNGPGGSGRTHQFINRFLPGK